jgi:hypothetical protein
MAQVAAVELVLQVVQELLHLVETAVTERLQALAEVQ